TDRAKDDAAAPARPTGFGARAPKPTKLATVEATVAEVARQTANADTALTPADVNGDARPDFITRDDGRSSLLISSPGPWARVPVRMLAGNQVEALPDLDGDGLGDFRTLAGVFVTDALLGGTPSTLDLRAQRPHSPRDLDLGSSNAPVFSALQAFAQPVGAVADVTGDGRTELALDASGTLVYASEDVTPGRRATLADFGPVRVYRGQFDGFTFSSGEGEAYDAVREDQQAGISGNVFAKRIVTVRASDLNKTPNVARPIELRTADGRGTTLSSVTFTAAGVARLVDHDPASGASVVALAELGPCRRPYDPFANRKEQRKNQGYERCIDHLVRVDADGNVRADVSLPRLDDERLTGTFIADGPDADALADLAITARGSMTSSPELTPERPTDGGTVALLPSSRTGALKITDLPVLAERGVMLQSLTAYSSASGADGTRWFAGAFQTMTEARSEKELDALRQRVGLVIQAP
ncbi:MAG: hypothetical protein Q7T55_05470, partial [Solirubrobacteraceae bacterium]|nr:hypothetical protein [Solirubrobacteraceae bacterium]